MTLICRECGSNIEEEGFCGICDHHVRTPSFSVNDKLNNHLEGLYRQQNWSALDGIMAFIWSDIERFESDIILAVLYYAKLAEENLTQLVPLYAAALNRFKKAFPFSYNHMLCDLEPKCQIN